MTSGSRTPRELLDTDTLVPPAQGRPRAPDRPDSRVQPHLRCETLRRRRGRATSAEMCDCPWMLIDCDIHVGYSSLADLLPYMDAPTRELVTHSGTHGLAMPSYPWNHPTGWIRKDTTSARASAAPTSSTSRSTRCARSISTSTRSRSASSSPTRPPHSRSSRTVSSQRSSAPRTTTGCSRTG